MTATVGSAAAVAPQGKLSKRARKKLKSSGSSASGRASGAAEPQPAPVRQHQREDMTVKAGAQARKRQAPATSSLPGGAVGPQMKKKARRGKGGGTAKAVASALAPQQAWSYKDVGKINTAPRDDSEPEVDGRRTEPVHDPATGVTTLPSGLQFIDHTPGKPNSKAPKKGKVVTIKYRGVVQQAVRPGERPPLPFGKGMLTWYLGSGEVIVGLDEGVRGMRSGGQRKVLVPPHLAYGDGGDGSEGRIPPNATLLFDVKLVRVGTKAEALQDEEAQLARQNKANAGALIRKESGRGMMAVMGQPSKDTGVIAMPLPSELCKKGRNRSGKPKQVSAWKEKRRRKTGKEGKNVKGGAGDFEKGFTRRGANK